MRVVKRNVLYDIWPWLLAGAFGLVLLAAAAWFFLGRAGEEEVSSAPQPLGDVYVCRGCGTEYTGSFPYISPWADCPTEAPARQMENIKETSRNGSVARATPVAMFQRVTGNLSARDDTDYYSFPIDVPGKVIFDFSFDGSRQGYSYLWNVAVYDTDGSTVLNHGDVPLQDNESYSFSTGESDLKPGTYYLKVSVASGGNPFMSGYSNTDYHIAFRPQCKEHTSVTQILTAAPDCVQGGEVMTVCDICEEQISTQEVEPLGHIWSQWKLLEEHALSSVLGDYIRVCALCGEKEMDTLMFHSASEKAEPDPSALTVTETWTEFGAAACAVEGVVETLCSVCGHVETEPKISPDHTFGDWETSRPAACTAQGQRQRACTACGYIQTEDVAPIPHTFGKAERVSGSILKPPILSQERCTQCGYVNTVEDKWSRWYLPGLLLLGAAGAALAVFLVPRALRRARQKRFHRQQNKTFLCPYCFNTSRISQVLIQCANPRCNEGMPIFRGNEIQWDDQGLPVSARCRCGHTTTRVLCPKCRNHLPESTLTGRDMIISVVGSRDTGKTHFISVIINELMGRVVPAFDGSFEGFDDTNERYSQLYKNQLYGALPTRLERTRTFRENPRGEDQPLIYTLKLKQRGPLGRGEEIRLFTLVFFDSAGEDLQSSEEIMRTLNRYICKSKGIIFLLDPLKIPAVRAQLDEGEVKRASSGDWYQPDDILLRISNLIRSDKGMRASDKIETPVSVVFSKFDVIEPIIPRGCTILEPSPHCAGGAFELADSENVDAEVQGLLQSWGAESFLRQMEVNYKNYACFTVSSLGMHNNPDAEGRISRPRPHRIEDPLLWLLVKQGVIKTKKGQEQKRRQR